MLTILSVFDVSASGNWYRNIVKPLQNQNPGSPGVDFAIPSLELNLIKHLGFDFELSP